MDGHKIALCIPNFGWQRADASMRWHLTPYGICLIAATVRDLCEVDIIDANMEQLSPGDFQKRVEQGNYDLVGISVLMDAFADSGFLTADLCRKASPETVIVMGGVYPTVHPEKAAAHPSVDYVVIGEGEEVFRRLLLSLWADAPPPQQGLAFKDQEGHVRTQPRAPLIADLDGIPLPAYDLVDFHKYARDEPRKAVAGSAELPYAHVLTSRGCPFDCSFCQVRHISGRKFRPRSPASILDEIAWLKETYGIKSLLMDDDNIVTDRQRAVELFKGMAERGLAMPWKAMAMAVFMLDEELIDLMAKSGCVFIGIAIESGSPRILKDVINKPIKLEHAKRMVEYAKSRGIFVSANYMIGFPTETWEEVRQTIRTAEWLDTDYVKIFTVIPLRNTRLWELCEKEGAFGKDFDPQRVSWNEGQIVSRHFDASELTILRAYEWDRINFSTPEKRRRICEQMRITPAELDEIRRDTRDSALAHIRVSSR